MRYDAEIKRIKIALSELVSIARRGVSEALSYDEDEPIFGHVSKKCIDEARGERELSHVSFDFSADGIDYTLDGAAYRQAGEASFTLVRKIPGDPMFPKKEVISQIRGEGFILGYAIAMSEGHEKIDLTFAIYGESGGKAVDTEAVSLDKLTSFWQRCIKTLTVYAKPEIDRVTVRLPSMRAMKFPYDNIREGQRELIRCAYRTLSRGGKLYASAPTGTGKTISAIFPALRALGDGRCDKAFYFTPKTTTAEAVRDCLNLISDRGVRVRAVILTAKEKCCYMGSLCKESRKLCPNSRCTKLSDALLELYGLDLTVIDIENVRYVSKKWHICPYELSLAYAELCDVVVCDINYLFDPHVYIKRFFTEPGRYAFLVDEAHNLSERVREAYSAEISTADLLSPLDEPSLGEFSDTKRVAADAERLFFDTVHPLVKEDVLENRDGEQIGASHTNEPPAELYSLFSKLSSLVEREIQLNLGARDEEAAERLAFLRAYHRKLRDFADTLERFDDAYQMFVFFEGGVLRAKLYCLDTGPIIRKRLAMGHGSMLFSATLAPLGYYREILGGDRSDEILEVNSPFTEEQLSVVIMDKISTRFSERDDTLGAVLRVIAATIAARRGNYMIFSPSFAYSDALARAFAAKYTKLHIISQRKNMTKREKEEFLAEFHKDDKSYLVAFCVMGGIYSEGIDLVGDKLIGAVIVGVGIPQLSYEREAIAAYYEEKFDEGKQYAYIYPGMNRVFQSAGRVIRTENDRGIIVLIDDRFDDPLYKKSLPALWHGVKFIGDAKELKAELDEFWNPKDK